MTYTKRAKDTFEAQSRPHKGHTAKPVPRFDPHTVCLCLDSRAVGGRCKRCGKRAE